MMLEAIRIPHYICSAKNKEYITKEIGIHGLVSVDIEEFEEAFNKFVELHGSRHTLVEDYLDVDFIDMKKCLDQNEDIFTESMWEYNHEIASEIHDSISKGEHDSADNDFVGKTVHEICEHLMVDWKTNDALDDYIYALADCNLRNIEYTGIPTYLDYTKIYEKMIDSKFVDILIDDNRGYMYIVDMSKQSTLEG